MAENEPITTIYEATWQGGVDKPLVKAHPVIETHEINGHLVYVIQNRSREIKVHELFANRHPSEFYFTREAALAYSVAMLEAAVRHSEQLIAQKRREIETQEANIARYRERINKAKKLLQESEL